MIAGYHRFARRAPSYADEPLITSRSAQDASEHALGYLINGRALAETITAPRLLGTVRALMSGAPCVQIVPGKLNATRDAIHRVVSDSAS